MAKRVQEGTSYAQSVVDLAVLGHPTNCKHAFDHIQSEELFGEDRDPVLEAFNEEERERILSWTDAAETRRQSRIPTIKPFDNEFEYLCAVKQAQREIQKVFCKYFPGIKIVLDPISNNREMFYKNEYWLRSRLLKVKNFEDGFKYRIETFIGEDDRRTVVVRLFQKDSIVESHNFTSGVFKVETTSEGLYQEIKKDYRSRFNVMMMKNTLRMAIRDEKRRLGVIE